MSLAAKALLAPPTPEERERERKRELERDRRRLVVELLIDGFRDGDMSFEAMCRAVVKVTKTFDLNENERERWVGFAVVAATAADAPKRGRGNKGKPRRIREAVLALLHAIRQRDGLPVNRATADARGVKTAYVRAAELFGEWGLAISSSEIEKWATIENDRRISDKSKSRG